MNDILKLIESNIEPKKKLVKKEDLYRFGIELLTSAGYNKPVEYLNSQLPDGTEREKE